MIFGKQKFDVKQLNMNKFISDVKQLKINKFIKSSWQLIISNSNATLEVPSLRLLLHSSSTVISSECITTLWLVALFCDSDEIKSLSYYILINFIYWTPLLFFSFTLLYLSTQFLCLLTCLSLVQPWIFSHFSSCFGVFGFCAFSDVVNAV